jgi:hypothetical protein
MILLTSCLAGCAIALLWVSMYRPLQQPQPSVSPPPFSVAPTPDVKNSPKPLTKNLNINGIMTMGDKNVALINNEIYEVGDMVNGMEIVVISLDRVQVLDQGKVRTFHK